MCVCVCVGGGVCVLISGSWLLSSPREFALNLCKTPDGVLNGEPALALSQILSNYK